MYDFPDPPSLAHGNVAVGAIDEFVTNAKYVQAHPT